MIREVTGLAFAFALLLCTGCSDSSPAPQSQATAEESAFEPQDVAPPFDEDSLFDLMLEAGEITERILGVEWSTPPVKEFAYSTPKVNPPRCSAIEALTSGGIQGYFNRNYLIVGSGFFGSICAYELKKKVIKF